MTSPLGARPEAAQRAAPAGAPRVRGGLQRVRGRPGALGPSKYVHILREYISGRPMLLKDPELWVSRGR